MARRLLTKKRENWVGNRSVTLKGEVLRHNIAAQDRYRKDLDRITTQMINEVRREIMRLFKSEASKSFYGQDQSVASLARILMNRLERKYTKLFNEKAKLYATRMVKNEDKISKSNLHSSLEKLSGGLSIKTDLLSADIKEVITATVAENVGLINTIPQTFLNKVRGSVMRSITQPATRGLAGVISDINKVLDKDSQNIRNKAKNIALDQTRKAYNNLNKGRMEAIGLKKFQWIHTGGAQKPRSFHKNVLNGKVFSFDNLPIIDEKTWETGIPGQLINCGCTMLPVLEFENGNIET